MAQTSTTILSGKDHKSNISGTVISFTKTGTEYKISSSDTSSSGASLANLSQYDLITVTGTTNNNSTFTVKSVQSDGSYIIVEEDVTTETAYAKLCLAYKSFKSKKKINIFLKKNNFFEKIDF